MKQQPSACRLCGGTRISSLGVLSDGDFFAGRVLAAPLSGGRLWSCAACRSMFRHPVLPDSEYRRLYAEGLAEGWVADEARQDVVIVRQLITAETNAARVLDVGCGGGEFLMTLAVDVCKFGVEPSLAAATVARHRGVSILAPTLDELSPDARFDFITMIDVIEHAVDPTELLDAALLHLLPGGSLIIATGDAGYVLWRRVFKSRFWYPSFPEHISFPSLDYLEMWRKKRGLQPPKAIRLRYRRLPLWKKVLCLVSQLGYFASPAIVNRVERMIDGLHRAPHPRRRFFSPAGSGVFRDHHVVQIQLPH
jgi:SAM-dependent methyltransferase